MKKEHCYNHFSLIVFLKEQKRNRKLTCSRIGWYGTSLDYRSPIGMKTKFQCSFFQSTKLYEREFAFLSGKIRGQNLLGSLRDDPLMKGSTSGNMLERWSRRGRQIYARIGIARRVREPNTLSKYRETVFRSTPHTSVTVPGKSTAPVGEVQF